MCCCFYINLLYQCFFFFNATPTTDIYTLSLHDALPIWSHALHYSYFSRELGEFGEFLPLSLSDFANGHRGQFGEDRKSTRLNSSHVRISYAVFCLKNKKKNRRKP